MKQWLVAGFLAVSPVWAQDPPASEASIREVLAVMKTRELMEGSIQQIEKVTRDAMKSALQTATIAKMEQAGK